MLRRRNILPVYKQTYRHYTGTYYPRAVAWWIIASRGLKRTWSGKGFRFLLLVSLAVFLVNVIRIYMVSNMELLRYMGFQPDQFREILEIDDKFYFTFLRIQYFFCFLVTLYVGTDIISADRRTKALVLYLSRPLGRIDYLFGKGFVVLFFLYCISLFPALLLMFFYAFFNDNWQYLVDNIPLMLRIFAYANIVVISLVILVLTISSLVKSKVGSGVMFCAVYFLPLTLGGIFSEMFNDPLFGNVLGNEWWSLFALQMVWEQLGSAIFQQPLPFEHMHWSRHCISLAFLLALCSVVLCRQIRAVEIVN